MLGFKQKSFGQYYLDKYERISLTAECGDHLWPRLIHLFNSFTTLHCNFFKADFQDSVLRLKLSLGKFKGMINT